MNNNLNNLKQEAQNIRMSNAEKSAMHARIFGLPAQAGAPVSKVPKVHSPYVFFFSYQRAVAFALVLVVLVGSTTAYAAQGTVPGDVLYSVKVKVNEPVSGALALSNTAKISFHTSIAKERLEEAEKLASEGKLSESATAQIEASFESHVAKAQTLAANLQEKDPEGAAGVAVTLDSSIAVHSNILAHIGSGSSDKATKENSQVIARSWNARGRGAEGATMALQAIAAKVQAPTMTLSVISDTAASGSANVSAKVSGGSSSTNASSSSQLQKKVALQLQAKAKAELSNAKDAFDDAKSKLTATTSAQVTAQITDLEARMEEGKKKYDAEMYIEAQAIFTAVLQDSIELSASIEASKKFKRDFVRPTWNRNTDWWNDDNKSGRDSDDDDSDHNSRDDNSSSNSGNDSDDDKGHDLPGNIELPVKLHL